MVNQPYFFEKNTEFFLLASYSCLPTVVARLDELQTLKTNAVLFCYSIQLYQFLSPLMKIYPWIKVFHIDVTELNTISPYRPWKIISGRMLLRSTYLRWFSQIPTGCRVNFYNRYYALSTFFMVWLLRNNCQVYFTDCDLLTKFIVEADRSLYSKMKSAFLSLVYPMPFEMSSGKDGLKTFPVLNKVFFDKTVKIIQPIVTDLTELKHTELFHNLSYKSEKKVLWLMSPVLDLELVPSDEYKQAFRECVDVVNSIFPSGEQAVKYHPRTVQKEYIWNESVECIPNNIPIEFIDLPNLLYVFVFSTSSLWSFSPNTKIIGLVDILPYISAEVQQTRRQYFDSYKSNSRKYTPSSLNELKQILTDKNL